MILVNKVVGGIDEMSIFRDDTTLSNALQKLQNNILQVNTFKETIPKQEAVSVQQQEPSEKIDISDIASKNQNSDSNIYENIQTDKNLAETAKQGLSSINGYLDDIKSQLEKSLKDTSGENNLQDISSSLKDDLKNIQKTVENTSFNDIKPLQRNSSNNMGNDIENNDTISSSGFGDTSLQALGLSEDFSLSSNDDVQAFLKKINSAREEVQARQENLTNYEENLVSKVDSLIKFDSNIPSGDDNLQKSVNELKEAAIKGINDNPDLSKKIQVNSLDDKIILALFSVSSKNR